MGAALQAPGRCVCDSTCAIHPGVASTRSVRQHLPQHAPAPGGLGQIMPAIMPPLALSASLAAVSLSLLRVHTHLRIYLARTQRLHSSSFKFRSPAPTAPTNSL